jgi:hypothetical protein
MAAAALNAAIASVACAEGTPVGYSIFGTPGLIEMPIATPAPDAEIAMSLGGFEDQQRASFTFQITPPLSGTFRYARLKAGIALMYIQPGKRVMPESW